MKLPIGKPNLEFFELWEEWNENLTEDNEASESS